MSGEIRVVRGIAYRRLAIVNPGSALFFTGPKRIAVETWALDWGQHEFDYELNSRATDGQGRPQAIASTEQALAREFLDGVSSHAKSSRSASAWIMAGQRWQ